MQGVAVPAAEHHVSLPPGLERSAPGWWREDVSWGTHTLLPPEAQEHGLGLQSPGR